MFSAQLTRIQRAGGLRIVAAGEVVFTVRPVMDTPRAARDEADDAVAGHRRAAAGEFDEAVIEPLDEDAVHGVAAGRLRGARPPR